MDFSFSVNQLQALSNLLTPAEQEEEDLEEQFQPEGGAIVLQPGQIGPAKRSNPTGFPDLSEHQPYSTNVATREVVMYASRISDEIKAGSSTVEPTDNKTIWAEDDVPVGSEFEDIWDTRQQPEYEILFKQSVGTEDVFLGMSRRDGSTACCEDMVIKIKLPGCKPADLTLDVKEQFLGLRSSTYKLGLHLPHPVDKKNGRAQFHSDTHTLEVTLTMKREYDFINFA